MFTHFTYTPTTVVVVAFSLFSDVYWRTSLYQSLLPKDFYQKDFCSSYCMIRRGNFVPPRGFAIVIGGFIRGAARKK